MLRKSSLTFKLAIAFAVVALAGLALVAVYVWRTTVGEFGTFMVAHESDDLVAHWAAYYAEHGSWEGVEIEMQPQPGQGGGPPMGSSQWVSRGRVAVVDEDGYVVIAGQGFRLGQQVPRSLTRQGVPITVDGEEVGRLLLGFVPGDPQAPSDRFMQRFNMALILGGGAAAALAVMLGVLLSSSLTRPLRELRTAAEALSRGEKVDPIPVRSHDELGELATTFNDMTSQLSHAQELRRQMTADIAHELRTPLSLILGHAEAMVDGVLDPEPETIGIIYDEALRLSRLVDDLRTLSLSDAGELSLVVENVAPLALLESAAAAHRKLAQESHTALIVEGDADLPEVVADPGRILQVLHNLVSNALRYTPAGGTIVLSAHHHPEGVVIAVSDTGPGIAPEDLPNVFERFYRSDRARQRDAGGSGLGLTIAR
ncbi:MAG: ATP-binding protein, partial [Anaerolineales bacterium]